MRDRGLFWAEFWPAVLVIGSSVATLIAGTLFLPFGRGANFAIAATVLITILLCIGFSGGAAWAAALGWRHGAKFTRDDKDP